MAQLNDLIVNGYTRFLNSAYGNLNGSATSALCAAYALNAQPAAHALTSHTDYSTHFTNMGAAKYAIEAGVAPVGQHEIANNFEYPMLLKWSANQNRQSAYVHYTSSIFFNPTTNQLKLHTIDEVGSWNLDTIITPLNFAIYNGTQGTTDYTALKFDTVKITATNGTTDNTANWTSLVKVPSYFTGSSAKSALTSKSALSAGSTDMVKWSKGTDDTFRPIAFANANASANYNAGNPFYECIVYDSAGLSYNPANNRLSAEKLYTNYIHIAENCTEYVTASDVTQIQNPRICFSACENNDHQQGYLIWSDWNNTNLWTTSNTAWCDGQPSDGFVLTSNQGNSIFAAKNISANRIKANSGIYQGLFITENTNIYSNNSLYITPTLINGGNTNLSLKQGSFTNGLNVTGGITGNLTGIAKSAENVWSQAWTSNSARPIRFGHNADSYSSLGFDPKFTYNPSTDTLSCERIVAGEIASRSGIYAFACGGLASFYTSDNYTGGYTGGSYSDKANRCISNVIYFAGNFDYTTSAKIYLPHYWKQRDTFTEYGHPVFDIHYMNGYAYPNTNCRAKRIIFNGINDFHCAGQYYLYTPRLAPATQGSNWHTGSWTAGQNAGFTIALGDSAAGAGSIYTTTACNLRFSMIPVYDSNMAITSMHLLVTCY